MPLSTRIDRAQLATLAQQPDMMSAILPDTASPLIVRPPGSHAGHKLEKADGPLCLPACLKRVPAALFHLIRLLNCRDPGDSFRTHVAIALAKRHALALAEIDRRIGLSYLGIDCAATPEGRLLMLEVDNAVVVYTMDDEPLHPYKKPAMRKVCTALRQLLEPMRRTAPR